MIHVKNVNMVSKNIYYLTSPKYLYQHQQIPFKPFFGFSEKIINHRKLLKVTKHHEFKTTNGIIHRECKQ